jgi:hypothetical protein
MNCARRIIFAGSIAIFSRPVDMDHPRMAAQMLFCRAGWVVKRSVFLFPVSTCSAAAIALLNSDHKDRLRHQRK